MAKKPKPANNAGQVICPDCRETYEAGAPHHMFCDARTCEQCGTTQGCVIQLAADGRRICDECVEECE